MQKDEGQLSAENLRNAGIKALQNASELVEEAQLLFEHSRWSRVVFLCCIAGEELGKCFISLSAVMNRRAGVFNENRYKERFRSHREKTTTLYFFEDVLVGSPDLPIGGPDIDGARATERGKLASLYSDFYGVEAHAPSELIPEQMASLALNLSKKRVDHFTERVRPMFDGAFEIDPAQIVPFQREFLRAVGANIEPESDSVP